MQIGSGGKRALVLYIFYLTSWNQEHYQKSISNWDCLKTALLNSANTFLVFIPGQGKKIVVNWSSLHSLWYNSGIMSVTSVELLQSNSDWTECSIRVKAGLTSTAVSTKKKIQWKGESASCSCLSAFSIKLLIKLQSVSLQQTLWGKITLPRFPQNMLWRKEAMRISPRTDFAAHPFVNGGNTWKTEKLRDIFSENQTEFEGMGTAIKTKHKT